MFLIYNISYARKEINEIASIIFKNAIDKAESKAYTING